MLQDLVSEFKTSVQGFIMQLFTLSLGILPESTSTLGFAAFQLADRFASWAYIMMNWSEWEIYSGCVKFSQLTLVSSSLKQLVN